MGFELIDTGARIVLGMPLEAVEPILGAPDQIEESVWRYRKADWSLDIVARDGLISSLLLAVSAANSGDGLKVLLFNGIQPGMSMDACAYAFGEYWNPTAYDSGTIHFIQAEDGQWGPLPIGSWPSQCSLSISTPTVGIPGPIGSFYFTF